MKEFSSVKKLLLSEEVNSRW